MAAGSRRLSIRPVGTDRETQPKVRATANSNISTGQAKIDERENATVIVADNRTSATSKNVIPFNML